MPREPDFESDHHEDRWHADASFLAAEDLGNALEDAKENAEDQGGEDQEEDRLIFINLIFRKINATEYIWLINSI